MKYLSKNTIWNPFISIVAGIFLFNCAAVEKVTQPTAKATPSTGPTIEQAQKEDYMGPKARVAVTKFVDKSAKGKETGQIGDGMAEMLANALFGTNRFIVLERQSLDDVIREQDLGASGRVKQESAAKIGEIEGADLLVEGTITEFEPGTSGAGGGTRGRTPGGVGGIFAVIRTSHVALIVKVVDAKTGRRLASEQVEGKATDFGGAIGGGGGGLAGVFAGYSKTPMEKAIRVAIEEAVKVIVTKTPSEYYRVHATPTPKATTAPIVKPPETVAPPTSSIPPTIPAPAPTPKPTPSPSLPSQPPVVTPETPSRITQVTVASENLRDGPNGKIIGKVKKGDSLAILDEKGNWLNIQLEDGTTAWIWKPSTSEAKPAQPSQAPPKQPEKGKKVIP